MALDACTPVFTNANDQCETVFAVAFARITRWAQVGRRGNRQHDTKEEALEKFYSQS